MRSLWLGWTMSSFGHTFVNIVVPKGLWNFMCAQELALQLHACDCVFSAQGHACTMMWNAKYAHTHIVSHADLLLSNRREKSSSTCFDERLVSNRERYLPDYVYVVQMAWKVDTIKGDCVCQYGKLFQRQSPTKARTWTTCRSPKQTILYLKVAKFGSFICVMLVFAYLSWRWIFFKWLYVTAPIWAWALLKVNGKFQTDSLLTGSMQKKSVRRLL